MYRDPYQYMGRLVNDIERAARLVVDVGLHYKGWTREEAIEYLVKNQPITSTNATQRIERYMVTPGQAISYKIGEQKILSLRKYAEQKLRSQFDIRDFHDLVLEDGALPLQVLERKVKRWVEQKKQIGG